MVDNRVAEGGVPDGALREVAERVYRAFAAWQEKPDIALDDDTLNALSDLGEALASAPPAPPPVDMFMAVQMDAGLCEPRRRVLEVLGSGALGQLDRAIEAFVRDVAKAAGSAPPAGEALRARH